MVASSGPAPLLTSESSCPAEPMVLRGDLLPARSWNQVRARLAISGAAERQSRNRLDRDFP